MSSVGASLGETAMGSPPSRGGRAQIGTPTRGVAAPVSSLRLRPGGLEGGHDLGECIEPDHEARMAGTPFAVVAEVEVAERAGEREVTVVGALLPGRRLPLQQVDSAVDLALLARQPG